MAKDDTDPSATTEHSNARGQDVLLTMRIQAHIAEYQALMTRNTHNITLQGIALPAILVSLSLLVQKWGSFDRTLLTWSAVLVVQVLVFWTLTVQWEQYNNIRYIETRLRDAISELGDAHVWGYERYLASQRRSHSQLWEQVPSGISLLVVVAGVLLRLKHLPLSRYDLTAIPSVLLQVGMWRQTKQVIGVRQDWSARYPTTASRSPSAGSPGAPAT